MYTKEQIIQNIKNCGRVLIDNAENIADNYEFPRNDIIITCYPSIEDEVPYINVSRNFYLKM